MLLVDPPRFSLRPLELRAQSHASLPYGCARDLFVLFNLFLHLRIGGLGTNPNAERASVV